MQYVRFGTTGIKVSRICLGCMTYGVKSSRAWALEEKDAEPYYKAALEAGINFFDTADVYSDGVSEEITGRALKKFARRDEYVLATKVNNPMGKGPNQRGSSRKHIMEGIDASLKRLGTDYVDLYIIHRLDPDTSMDEIIEALHDVVKAGKALYIGASSMRGWQFAKLVTMQKERGLTRFASMQNYYNLIYREEEREMLPLCQAEGIGVIPWSPLARGRVARAWDAASSTDRTARDEYGKTLYTSAVESDRQVIERVGELSEKRGVPRAQLGLAWLLSKAAVTAPIVGATQMRHLDDAAAAVHLKLSAEEIAALEAPYLPHAVVGF
jgi:aryl-alcohol dehydrogenase-like predicted oxidoreductase